MDILQKKEKRDLWFPYLGAACVFILCFCILYLGENVGLSDNGDFRRVLLTNDLKYQDETDKYYLFKEHYEMELHGESFSDKIKGIWFAEGDNTIYASPHSLVIKLSKILNYLANCVSGRPENSYHIGWLAFIYISMLTMAAWAIFNYFSDYGKRLKISILAIFLIIFCDGGYVMYFNSFYGEPLQYVSIMMLICVGLLIYKRPSIPKIVCFYICLYFFAGAKLVNIIYAVLVIGVSLTFLILRKDKLFKIGVVCAAAVCMIFLVRMYTTIPDWMENDTNYQAVFFGITKDSPDPEQDLKELGIDTKYLSLVNTNAYMEEGYEYAFDRDSEDFQTEFYDKISKWKIGFFYLRHPGRLAQKVAFAIENSAFIKPPNLGNSTTTIMESSDRFSLWSRIRIFIRFVYSPLAVVIFVGVITAYTVVADIFLYRRRKVEDPKRLYMVCGINVLILGIWINMMLPVMANGEADIVKHMFLFVNFMDLLLAALILYAFYVKKSNLVISAVAITVLVCVMYFHTPPQTVTFGSFEGKPIEWEVLGKKNDEYIYLVSKKNIKEMEFDGQNNFWETSELRNWLNHYFIKDFTQEELARIIPVNNEILLSASDKDKADAGDHAHFWNCTKQGVDDLADTAYRYTLNDRVFIPTLNMLQNIKSGGEYWVLCPYTANSTMQRYMDRDGFILHTDVKNTRGVRPVIAIRTTPIQER